MGLKDYIRIFKRHRWWIVGWFVLITAGYWFYDSALKHRRFYSVANIKVNSQNMDNGNEVRGLPKGVSHEDFDPDILEHYAPPSMHSLKSDMGGYQVMLDTLKRYLILAESNPGQNTAGEHALNQEPYPVFKNKIHDEENVKRIKYCLKFTANASNGTFDIKAHSTNQFKTKWIIESFVEAYSSYVSRTEQKAIKSVIESNKGKVEELIGTIEKIKEERSTKQDFLTKKYGNHIVWKEGPSRKLAERDEMLGKISVTYNELIKFESEVKEFDVYDPERWLIDDGEGNKIVELQNELYSKRETLRKEVAALRTDFKDIHPKVVKKLAELNSLDEAFPKLAKEIINEKIRTLKRSIRNRKLLNEKQDIDLKRFNKEIKIISENHQVFKDYDDKVAKNNTDINRIELHLDKYQDRLSILSAVDPVEIQKNPEAGIPENENPNQIYFIMVFGILIGLGFAYILEYLDDTIRTPHDVEKFVGLRVIGTVPMLSKGEEKLLHRIALKSPISEMMNTLSMIIQSWLLKMQGQALLIVSSKPSEGKSTFITNLSVALCRGGEKVVLIDSDLRKPSLHRFFGIDNSIGLANYLEDSFAGDVEDTDEAKIAKIVHHTDIEGLFVIPSGPIPSNPVGLLKGDNMERLLNHLKTYIGVILIDTPPLAMIDAGVLATKVNAVVTVMDAGKVTKKEALAGKHLIENVGGNNIGVILNKVTLEGEEYYYYFEGYSYYYGGNRGRKKKPV